jgi:hypothetical protein
MVKKGLFPILGSTRADGLQNCALIFHSADHIMLCEAFIWEIDLPNFFCRHPDPHGVVGFYAIYISRSTIGQRFVTLL